MGLCHRQCRACRNLTRATTETSPLRNSLAQGPWEHRTVPTVPVPSATASERRLPKQGSEHTHAPSGLGEGLSF